MTGFFSRIRNLFRKGDDDDCIFCKICKGKAPGEILYQDDEIVIFKDMFPIAEHHYLAVPKVHIINAKSLAAIHINLLENMVQHGKEVLTEHGANINDMIMGFHWPPFNSVNHLHLHIISPASEIKFIHRQMFKPNSSWFVTVDYVLDSLRSKL